MYLRIKMQSSGPIEYRPKLVVTTTSPMTLRFLAGQLEYLAHAGFDVHVVSSPGVELEKTAASGSAKAFPLAMARRPSVKDLGSLVRHLLLFKRLRPTIIFASTPKAGLLGMVAGAMLQVPIRVYLLRGMPLVTASYWQRPVLWLMEAITCRLAHVVQCVSDSLRDDAIRLGLADPDRCLMLHNGSSNGVDAELKFNPSLFPEALTTPMRVDLGLPDSVPVFGFVGRLSLDKGLKELLAAWDIVQRRHPAAHLLVLGPIDQVSRAMRKVLESLRSMHHVHLLTNFFESAPYFRLMDVLVHPSHREGFPNAPLEAAAMGIPTITTNAVGCRDAIVDGITGRIVPVGDANAIAAAIIEYIEMPELRARHGAAARARVLSDFKPEDLWRAQVQLFRDLIARRDVSVMKHEPKQTRTGEAGTRRSDERLAEKS